MCVNLHCGFKKTLLFLWYYIYLPKVLFTILLFTAEAEPVLRNTVELISLFASARKI